MKAKKTMLYKSTFAYDPIELGAMLRADEAGTLAIISDAMAKKFIRHFKESQEREEKKVSGCARTRQAA